MGAGDDARNVNLIGHAAGGIGAPSVSRGRAAERTGELVVNDSLGLHLGDHVVVGSRPFEVVGIVNDRTYFAGVPMIFAVLGDAQALAFGGQPLATVIVTKGSPAGPPPGMRLLSNDGARSDLLRPMGNPTTTIDNTRVAMWLVAALIVGAVTYLSVLERLRDFAVFRAVGGSTRALALTVCLEAVLASTIAALLAAVLANVLKQFFPIPLDITGPGLPGVADRRRRRRTVGESRGTSPGRPRGSGVGVLELRWHPSRSEISRWSTHRAGTSCGPSTIWISTHVTASSCCCSGPADAARPRCCHVSPGSCRPRAAPSRWERPTSVRCGAMHSRSIGDMSSESSFRRSTSSPV